MQTAVSRDDIPQATDIADFNVFPDAAGHFGRYGGVFVSETLVEPLRELEAAYDAARRDPAFQAELEKAGFGAITTEIAEAPVFYYAEGYHQQYLYKVPNGYRCHANTGLALPAL